MSLKLIQTQPTKFSEIFEQPIPETVGRKFERGRDIKDIAKLVRADIKEAVKNGGLPKAKYSVTIDRFSMGCSLDIRLSGVDGLYGEDGRYTEEGKRVNLRLETIMEQYNRDRSDSRTDYFETNFYGHVRIER